MGRQSGDTAERIRNAAIALFGARGFRAVTIDEIASRANVTKRTVYCHFRSKDDLIAACLDATGPEAQVLDALGLSAEPDLEADLTRAFSRIAELCADIRWTGDAFVRAAIEMAGLPGHPASVGARRQQSRLEEALRRRLEALGLAEPESLARRLLVLLNGTIVHGLIHHDPDYVEEAAGLALELIAAAKRYADVVRFGPRKAAIACPDRRPPLERRRALPG